MVETGADVTLIVHNPRIQGGEPVIRSTRVSVRSIVLAHLEDGLEPGGIVPEFLVGVGAVKAVLTYYDAYKAEIDRIIGLHDRAAHQA